MASLSGSLIVTERNLLTQLLRGYRAWYNVDGKDNPKGNAVGLTYFITLYRIFNYKPLHFVNIFLSVEAVIHFIYSRTAILVNPDGLSIKSKIVLPLEFIVICLYAGNQF